MRMILNIVAGLVRALWDTFKVIFRGIRGLALALMLVLNIALIAVPGVYNVVSGVFWRVVAVVAEGYALQSETRAMRLTTLEQTEADLATTRNQLGDISTERDALLAERQELNRRLSLVDAELTTTRQRLTDVEFERDDMRAERDDARLRETLADDRVIAVERERDVLGRQLTETQVNAREVRITVRNTVQQVKGRSLAALVRNTSATFVEMLPLLGTAAAVGAIALDVVDICATVEDMQSIEAMLQTGNLAETPDQSWCGLSAAEISIALFGGPGAVEMTCINARLQSGQMSPPECEDYPILLPDEGVDVSPATPAPPGPTNDF